VTKQDISKSLYQSGQDDVTVLGSDFRVQKSPLCSKNSYEGIFPDKNRQPPLESPNYSHDISRINEHSFNKEIKEDSLDQKLS